VFTNHRACEHLGPDACRRLLGSEHLGRVALSVAALPAVLPVLYRLIGDRVVFAVEDDLSDVLSDNIVAFEVDRVDPETNLGWSVQVIGRTRSASDLRLPGFGLPGFERPGFAPPAPEMARTSVVPRPDRLIGLTLDRLSGQRTLAPVGDQSGGLAAPSRA
jgi:hypothetical protein